MRRVLVVRLDSDGDVLLAGPAVRAVAHQARVTLLVSPQGVQAARLLPGVAEILVWDCPWEGFAPPPVDAAGVLQLVDLVRSTAFGEAIVLGSFHQSPLPAALILRLARVGRITARSEDHPGSLLDVRLRPSADDPAHEVERAVQVVAAAGFPPARGDCLALAVRGPLPNVDHLLPERPYVVLHPGASVPARAPAPEHAAQIARAVAEAGWPVLVTGSSGERALTSWVTGEAASTSTRPVVLQDLGGRTSFETLAAVLARAACMVVGNTGPAHLAAAVGTPVVSLFAPVVDADAWRPWGVPGVVLGDQWAPCAGSRARACPVAGHPCLTSIAPEQVVAAIGRLTARAPLPRPEGVRIA